ncbi:MAG: TRAP transporter permease [Pseudomonadota bacterium]
MQDAAMAKSTTAEDLVAQVDTGARNPAGFQGPMIIGICILWSLYQLYIASGLPEQLAELTGLAFNYVKEGTTARYIHLAFALTLATFAFPLFKQSPRDRIPLYDWALVILGLTACLYLVVFKDYATALRETSQLPMLDIVMGSIGMGILLISVYRSLGLPLMILSCLFISLVLFGHYIFDIKQFSYSKALGHFWVQTEGVFGVALGVSTAMIFLFVLFGGILEKAGAGNWFIKVAVALLGSLRGGPAKASVLSSALTGMISGSSIANTVTTGTFTIPLMRRIGFSAEKAGAVEVASSTNGQLTPPVMGAAAFLMVEYVGISYLEVIKHAFLPAVISYIALLYIVHLESLKLGLQGLEKAGRKLTVPLILLLMLSGFIFMAILTMAILAIQALFGSLLGNATLPLLALLGAMYIALVYVASHFPEIERDDPNAAVVQAPRLTPTLFAGLYFALPIFVLIWNLMIERLSPALSATNATMIMMFVAFTHIPLKAFFRGEADFVLKFRQGFFDVVNGFISGARNMIGIGVATAAAGIIVGTLSLTGAHQIIVEIVEAIAGDNIILLLVLVALLSLILGMGLPTTANYIIVSSLMAPVILSVGQDAGLIVPLIAIHMFVFYFGILADDTPPVGLAAYAAAAISRGDPIKTGIQGFTYDIRTAALPFMFIFNTDLLLYGIPLDQVDGILKAVFIFGISLVAMLLFAAATQGYFVAKSRFYETGLLLLIAFTLFRPGYFMDMVVPPFEQVKPTQVFEAASRIPKDGKIRLQVEGPDARLVGKIRDTFIELDLGNKGSGQERFSQVGFTIQQEGDAMKLDEPFGAQYRKFINKFDFYGDTPVKIIQVLVPVQNQFPKELFFIPALLLLGFVILLQRGRATQPAF